MGLVRTFTLYCTLPREAFPLVAKCEQLTDESRILFDSLESLFWEITEQQGIDFYIPGFDYEGFFQQRRRELEALTDRTSGSPGGSA